MAKRCFSVNNQDLWIFKRLYNYQSPINCPFDENFLSMEIVYSAEIKTNDQQFSNVYLGTSETEVKTKYNNHLKLS